MKRQRKIFDKGRYIVDESFRGNVTGENDCIVMDNTISRNPNHHNKTKISYFITSKPGLLIGNNTVAIFKIKKRQASADAQ